MLREGKGLRILIAEDDYASRLYLYNILTAYGECDLTIDGIEALDAYFLAIDEGLPYDVACIDIMMPKVDGLKVYKTIRKTEKDKIKIIMTTALTDSKNLFDKSLENDIYLIKPISAESIINAMDKFGFGRKNL